MITPIDESIIRRYVDGGTENETLRYYTESPTPSLSSVDRPPLAGQIPEHKRIDTILKQYE